MVNKSTDLTMAQFDFLIVVCAVWNGPKKLSMLQNLKKNNLKTIPIVCTQNVQSFAMKPLVCSLWFHLSLEHFDHIFMVDKSTEHGKLFSIC